MLRVMSAVTLALALSLAASGENSAASVRRGIPAGGVAPPSTTPDISGGRALPAGSPGGLVSAPDLHHGRLGRAAGTAAQAPAQVEPFHSAYDQLLDLNVRDGFVYYAALRSERGRLDRYVASLNVAPATYERWSRDARLAFWVNAYNAIVLQTVVNHYPIRGRASAYPAASIRQIPGAFERTAHRVAGRALTLDEIEKSVLPEFRDPRVYLALGRAAVGSGRLRSEAYTAARLEAQLESVRTEFVDQHAMFRLDRLADQISVTPIISWRESEFVEAYGGGGQGASATRSPIERAILAFAMPGLLRLEREFVERDAFRIVFHDFDWRLNDLTGGRVN